MWSEVYANYFVCGWSYWCCTANLPVLYFVCAEYAKLSGITNSVIGKSAKKLLKKDFEDELIDLLPNVEVHIITESKIYEESRKHYYYAVYFGGSNYFTYNARAHVWHYRVASERYSVQFLFCGAFSPLRHRCLGLSICKSIIDAHGGEIWADNRKAGGAKFSFSLPLAGDDDYAE